MHETYKSEAFPQDQTLSTFSSTNIYWLPAASGESSGDGHSEGPQVEDDSTHKVAPPSHGSTSLTSS